MADRSLSLSLSLLGKKHFFNFFVVTDARTSMEKKREEERRRRREERERELIAISSGVVDGGVDKVGGQVS